MTGWPRTDLCDLLGIEHPIIQAPMAGATPPAVAVAVSNAGGLGSLGCAAKTPDQVREDVAALQDGANHAFNINFFVHDVPEPNAEDEAAMQQRLAPYYAELGLGEAPTARSMYPIFGEEMLEVVTKLTPPVVSFHFGLPDRAIIEGLKSVGTVILASATTVREAIVLEAGGVDAIIAQGLEAGGHRGTFLGDIGSGNIGTFALVPQVADAVKLPVIAAGGVADGRAIAAAFALGASGVQMGTAFLACPEMQMHPLHRELLLKTLGEETQVTRSISGRPARAIVNRYITEMSESGAEPLAFPLQYSVVGSLNVASRKNNSTDLMVMWAGQGAALSKVLPAGELLTKLAEDAQAVLARM